MSKHKDLLFEVALSLIPGIGDTLAKNLVSYCGGAEEVFRHKKHKLQRIPGIGGKLADSISSFKDFKRAEAEIRFIEKHHIQPLFFLDKKYPSRLKAIPDAPLIMYYLGEADLENTKIVGIVGTRKCTEYGKTFVENLVSELSDTGAMIISGLAFGIDIQAHRQALKNNLPTVGVIAHGLDRIYPSQHKTTAKKMLDKGGLLTEFMSNTNPDRENFPKRNRIVAGLCDVLVVVETAVRGGGMITAELANSYNKDVMAVPGRTTDEYSGGCNQLIRKNKAAIITSTQDLLELMNWDLAKPAKALKQPSLHLDLSEDDRIIVNYLRERTKAGIDDISYSLQMDAGMLSLKLLDLEFSGVIRSLPGKYFELV